MKLVFGLFASLVVGAASSGMNFAAFDASSKAARNLLLSSLPVDPSGRRLEDAVDTSFVADHSIYFDGCHNTTSWYNNAYSVVPVVRFRLCPSKYVHSGKCFSKKIGEYLTPMTTFVDAYMEYHLSDIRQKCESMRESCGCEGNNDDCTYHCYETYSDLTWSQCAQEQGKEEQLGECQKFEVKNNRRFLEQNENKYYIGPYCGPGGDGVFLNLFTDQYCTAALPGAAAYYNYVSGSDMPYQYTSGATGMVEKGWIACTDQQSDNNDNNKNGEDGTASKLCEEAYASAAKCEANMTTLTYPDTSACSYIAQVKSQSQVAYQFASVNTMTWAAFMFVVGGVATLGLVTAYIHAKKRSDSSSRSTPLVVEVDLS